MNLFDVAGELPGDLVVVQRARRRAEALCFEEAARGLGVQSTPPSATASGRQTVIHSRTRRRAACRHGSLLADLLRRTKSPEELAVTGRACAVCGRDHGCVRALVQRQGATMLALVEEVEDLTRVNGLCVPSSTTHVFSGRRRQEPPPTTPAPSPSRRRYAAMFDFGAVVDGDRSGLRPDGSCASGSRRRRSS